MPNGYIWAIWVKKLPYVSNIHCKMYVCKTVFNIKLVNSSVRLAACNNNNC